MNQILKFYDNFSLPNDYKNNKYKKIFFKITFFVSIGLFILLTLYYVYTQYKYKESERVSKEILNKFNISTLYSDTANYNTSTISSSGNTSFSIIGLIEIPRIGINYPIISSVSEDFLKIAPCRFYGPLPNEVGNLCIAGHNYNNYKFFSKLKNLELGDKINIFDSFGQKLTYFIYKKYEIDATDFSCTNQNTNGKKEITLITCNNIKGKRRVIKAINKNKSGH